MITQELVNFIKQQLGAGKSKQEIAEMLMPHGWALEDINSVFAQIMPSVQPVAPQVDASTAAQSSETNPQGNFMSSGVQSVQASQTPSQTSQPAVTVQSAMTQAAQQEIGIGFLDRVKNPSALYAGFFAVFAVIASTLIGVLPMMRTAGGSLDGYNLAIGIILGISFIGVIINGLITKLITKILKIEPRTFAKAFTFNALVTIGTSLFSLISLLGVSQGIAFIPGILIWFLLFGWFYETTFVKTLLGFLLEIVFVFILGVIIVLGMIGAGLGFISQVSQMFLSDDQRAEQQLLRQEVQNQIMIANQEMQNIALNNIGTSTAMAPENNELPTIVFDGVSDTSTVGASSTENPSVNYPDLSHVIDALPVGIPFEGDKDTVVRADIIEGTNSDEMRYVLEYKSTHSLAYLRNNYRQVLTAAGYAVSVNESNLDYRVITATRVVRTSTRTIVVILEQEGDDARVTTSLFQQ